MYAKLCAPIVRPEPTTVTLNVFTPRTPRRTRAAEVPSPTSSYKTWVARERVSFPLSIGDGGVFGVRAGARLPPTRRADLGGNGRASLFRRRVSTAQGERVLLFSCCAVHAGRISKR